jgi:hypothetical protein
MNQKIKLLLLALGLNVLTAVSVQAACTPCGGAGQPPCNQDDDDDESDSMSDVIVSDDMPIALFADEVAQPIAAVVAITSSSE